MQQDIDIEILCLSRPSVKRMNSFLLLINIYFFKDHGITWIKFRHLVIIGHVQAECEIGDSSTFQFVNKTWIFENLGR